MSPTAVFDLVSRYSSADSTSPERTEADMFSSRLHHRANCNGQAEATVRTARVMNNQGGRQRRH
jgi:hypothetical protein